MTQLSGSLPDIGTDLIYDFTQERIEICKNNYFSYLFLIYNFLLFT